jgi:hypothetical protein
MAREDVGSWDASGKEQCVKVGDSIRGGPRLGDRVATAWADIVFQRGYGPRSIISTNSCETGHACQNHRPWRFCLAEVLAPEPRGTAVAGFEYDRGAVRAPALQVDAPTAANVDQASKVILVDDLHRRGSARDAECGDRTEGNGDGQGTDRMTKLQGTHHRFVSFQAVISDSGSSRC